LDHSLSLPRPDPSINEDSLHLDRIHFKGPSPTQGRSPDAEGEPPAGRSHRRTSGGKAFQGQSSVFGCDISLLSQPTIPEKILPAEKLVALWEQAMV
jgi:hypothetical protein